MGRVGVGITRLREFEVGRPDAYETICQQGSRNCAVGENLRVESRRGGENGLLGQGGRDVYPNH